MNNLHTRAKTVEIHSTGKTSVTKQDATQDEVESRATLCESFGELFPRNFPD